MENVVTWRDLVLVLAGLALFLVLQTWVILTLRRRSSAIHDEEDLEMAALRGQLAGLSFRLDGLEKRQWDSHPWQEGDEESLDIQFADTTYNAATQLAKEGLDARELATRCGISLSEAELIVALSKQEK